MRNRPEDGRAGCKTKEGYGVATRIILLNLIAGAIIVAILTVREPAV